MKQPQPGGVEFVERFMDRRAAERYRDRYRSGRHARVNQMEQTALRELLRPVGRLNAAMDLPCGTGRLAAVLRETADRIILADSSPIMLELAREEAGEAAEYLQTNAEQIDLPTGSVDLVFCHRLLNHIPDSEARARIVKELARISRKYVAISCYPPGLRTRFKTLVRKLVGAAASANKQASLDEYITLAAAAGLKPAGRTVFRRPPYQAQFVLFEHTKPLK
jgi:ubiquinone/menaquinone biosynthesis C-methylase UbiE